MNLLCITLGTLIQLSPIIGAGIAAIIVIIGWGKISSLNRKNEIKKELRGYGLEMLRSIIELQIDFQKTGVLDKKLYDNMTVKIKTFGTNEDISAFNIINDGKIALERDNQRYLDMKADFKAKLEAIEVNHSLQTAKKINEVDENELKESEEKLKESEEKLKEEILKQKNILNTLLMELLDACRNKIRKELNLYQL